MRPSQLTHVQLKHLLFGVNKHERSRGHIFQNCTILSQYHVLSETAPLVRILVKINCGWFILDVFKWFCSNLFVCIFVLAWIWLSLIIKIDSLTFPKCPHKVSVRPQTKQFSFLLEKDFSITGSLRTVSNEKSFSC